MAECDIVLSMRVYLVRHGAYGWEFSGERGPRLAREGWAQARAAGAYLAQLGARPEAALVSPYVRSQETAAGILEVLDRTAVEQVEVLSLLPEGEEAETEVLLKAWAEAGTAELLVVGHMGSIGRLARRLDPLAPGSFGLCTVAVFEGDGVRWQLTAVADCGRTKTDE